MNDRLTHFHGLKAERDFDAITSQNSYEKASGIYPRDFVPKMKRVLVSLHQIDVCLSS